MCPKAQPGSQNQDHASGHPIPQSPFLGAPQLSGSRERFGVQGGEECRGVRVKVGFEAKKPIREVDLGGLSLDRPSVVEMGVQAPQQENPGGRKPPSPLGLTSSSDTGGLPEGRVPPFPPSPLLRPQQRISTPKPLTLLPQSQEVSHCPQHPKPLTPPQKGPQCPDPPSRLPHNAPKGSGTPKPGGPQSGALPGSRGASWVRSQPWGSPEVPGMSPQSGFGGPEMSP
ncbi:PREDICTED: splicing factor, proline- and glutamine-rich-like [Ficedula albicollis]|uniref:splicing factor, proline- and glutamine-rich-like n=1 Tax=Ficedula albicollis TaxID=59894 RepID=UPI0007AD91FE|nr:PREDICTED: splicing factor, proline- and glutamine-rich-like [Ficedula albicollis]